MLSALSNHKTLYIVLFWLLILSLSVFTTSGEELSLVLKFAGWVSLAYVGVAKVADIAKAARAPKGEFGFEAQPFYNEKYWWVVAYWCVLLVLLLILRFVRQGSLYPIEDCVFFAGLLSTTYAGLNKGASIAAQAGVDKAART